MARDAAHPRPRLAGGVWLLSTCASVLLFLATACAPSTSGAKAANPGLAPELVARGEEIFQRKVGTLSAGCAFCHGEDGRGNLAPAIQGKAVQDIRKALETVPQMKPLELSDGDIEAVAAYLKRLQTRS